MNFIIDAQLPPALTRFLRAEEYAAEHVADVKMLYSGDRQIWMQLSASDAAIVTKDEDFAVLAVLDATGPQVVWLRIGNCSNRALIHWLGPLLPEIVVRLQRGERLIEVV